MELAKPPYGTFSAEFSVKSLSKSIATRELGLLSKGGLSQNPVASVFDYEEENHNGLEKRPTELPSMWSLCASWSEVLWRLRSDAPLLHPLQRNQSSMVELLP